MPVRTCFPLTEASLRISTDHVSSFQPSATLGRVGDRGAFKLNGCGSWRSNLDQKGKTTDVVNRIGPVLADSVETSKGFGRFSETSIWIITFTFTVL